MFSIPETLKTEADIIDQGGIPKPRMAILINSYKCNQACYFCFHRPYNDGYVMPTGKLISLIDDLSEFGVRSVDFCGGGEPLCAPDMDHVFDYIASKGMKQCLITNGSLLKGKAMESIIKHGTFVRVSLDTVDRELYKKIHGADHLDKVLENIKTALEYKKKINSYCDISVKVSVTEHTTEKVIEDVFAYFENEGLTSIQVKLLWDENGKYLNNDITKEKLGRLNARNTTIVRKTRYSKYMPERCWISPIQTTIDAVGNVFLCCYYQRRDEEHKIGNVFDNSFSQIWGSQNHRQKIKKIEIKDCLKHDCRFQKYMLAIKKNQKKGYWDFV